MIFSFKDLKRSVGFVLDRVEPEGRIKTLLKKILKPSTSPPLYSDLIRKRIEIRKKSYVTESEPNLISFTTTVWNTPIEFLSFFSQSVLKQKEFGSFEWVILDNGSTDPNVISFLRNMSEKYKEVKLLRAEQNLGIIGGNRLCLENATGRYIVPLDSDDYIYPDTLQLLTYHIKKHNYAPLFYSDEDKLYGKAFREPYVKPPWDPTLFLDSCYIAHICAIDRSQAIEFGVYTDSRTNGSHDWDTFCRFFGRGISAIHIPEILYSWRMHSASTAMNINAKNYIHTSQQQVLSRYLEIRNLNEEMQVVPSPIFQGTPDWWIRLKKTSLNKEILVVDIATESTNSSAKQILGAVSVSSNITKIQISNPSDFSAKLLKELSLRSYDCVVVASAKITHISDDWLLEYESCKLLFSDMGVLGGRIRMGQTITAAGYYFGLLYGAEDPDIGKSMQDPGYYAQLWKRRSVDAFNPIWLALEPKFLSEFCAEYSLPVDYVFLGLQLGVFAKLRNKRCVYSPHIVAESGADSSRSEFRKRMPEFVKWHERELVSRYYPNHLGREPQNFYLPSRLNQPIGVLDI